MREGERGVDRRSFLALVGMGAAAPLLPERVAGARAPVPWPQEDTGEVAVADPAGAVTARTFEEAEKLAGIEFTPGERDMMVGSIEEHLERLRARRTMDLPEHEAAPALIFDPRLPGRAVDPGNGVVRFTPPADTRAPDDDEAIAFAPVSVLAGWIANRTLTSQRLTRIYLERLERLGPALECVITLTEELAMTQARRADVELAGGRSRGPLHGIPWGAKDLFDTAGIGTTWGAMPYRQRVPERDATVVRRLEEAGAVLVAKLSLGALAYNDLWFGGRTRNPWNLEQGSSGSSAGSAAATVAGLVGFSLGTETYGSIVSPCMRCGATGLRPTFGRVGRGGAMPLCWSLDKVGPICRTVEDCVVVLQAINGRDERDPASVDQPLTFDAERPARGLRLGYAPAWFEGRRARDLDRHVLELARGLGLELVEIDLPDWPYDVLLNVLFAEAAAAFEAITRDGRDDELRWQEPRAWPNAFRQSWFIPAVEYVQTDRFRRRVMGMMAERLERADAILSPSFAASLLLITNNTGHPSLTLRTGFDEDGSPHGITLWGRLFDEGTLGTIGMALERELGVWDRRPDLEKAES